VLHEASKLLYESYIARKSFSYASGAVSELLVGELQMCYVRHDDGEAGWRTKSKEELRRVDSDASPQRAQTSLGGGSASQTPRSRMASGTDDWSSRPGSAPAATDVARQSAAALLAEAPAAVG
ncbi:unnamed protein product, partial [Polarella glacialis]